MMLLFVLLFGESLSGHGSSGNVGNLAKCFKFCVRSGGIDTIHT